MNKQVAVVLLFFIIIFWVRCYTTFKHPEIYSTSDSTNVYYHEEITFIEDCSSCHEQNDPINDTHLQVYDYPLYQENYNWQYYYVIPWWIDEYYYQEQPVSSEEKLPAPQRRDFDRRGMSPSVTTESPNPPGISLSKPATTDSTPGASPPPSKSPKRPKRREVIVKENPGSQTSTTTTTSQEKKEKKGTKKKKK